MISEAREACRNFVRLAARRVGRTDASVRIGASSRRGASEVAASPPRRARRAAEAPLDASSRTPPRAQRELQRTLVVACVDAVSRAFIEAGKRTWMSR